MTGFLAVRRAHLDDLPEQVPGFKLALELMVRHQGSIPVVEIPSEFREREQGRSKLGPGVIWDYLRQLAGLAGGNVSNGSTLRFILVGLLGALGDLTLFRLLSSGGLSLGSAHVLSFLAATLMNYLFNARWAFRHQGEAAAPLSGRNYAAFLSVALLAPSAAWPGGEWGSAWGSACFRNTPSHCSDRHRLENEGVRQTSGRHLFSGKNPMYEHWFPAGHQIDRTMILVAQAPEDLPHPEVFSRVRNAGSVQELILGKKRDADIRFFYRLIEGYRGADVRS